MAQKVGGGRGPGGGRGGPRGGGKSGQGPRQPAGRKYGSAGAVKTGQRGTRTSGTGGSTGSGGAGQGRTTWEKRTGSAAPKRGTGGAGRPERDGRPPRRGAPGTEYKPARDKAPGRPARQGSDAPGRGAGPRPEGRRTGERPGRPARPGADTRGRSAGPRPDTRGRDERTRTPRRQQDERDARPRKPAYDKKPERARRPVQEERPVRERKPAAAVQEEPAVKPRPFAGKDVGQLDWHHTDLEGKVVGLNPVIELLRSGGRAIDSVFIDNAKGGKLFNDIMALARSRGITVKLAPKEALDKMSAAMRHQGAVAIVSPKEYADADELVDSALGKGTPPVFVLLDGVEDPQNLGSVIRTAEAAGADGVFIPEHRAAHLSAAVSRASAGALEHVPVAKVKNMAGFIDALKQKGVWVVGVEAGSASHYTSLPMTEPVALVLGSEGAGIRPVVKKACDALVALPMQGKVNSLNVSVAAGIMLYEVLRQRAAIGLDEE